MMKRNLQLSLTLFLSTVSLGLPVFAQIDDPDMIPPEVFVPVPGAPTMPPASVPTNTAAYPQAGLPQAGMSQGGMPQAGMSQGGAIQAFVPAGWPFDGLPPPGSGAPQMSGMQQAFNQQVGRPGANYPTQSMNQGAPFQQQFQQPTSAGVQPQANSGFQQGGSSSGFQQGSTFVQGSPAGFQQGMSSTVGGTALAPGEVDSSAAGPFSTEKECLLCKKKKGEAGYAEEAAAYGIGQSGQSAGAVAGAQMAPAQAGAAQGQSSAVNPHLPKPDPVIVIQTTKGPITIRLFRQYAPHTVANFVDLVQKGFYNGLRWHRVVPGFVIQAGCPKGDGTGGYVDPATGKPRNVPLELHQRLRHNAPGVVAMARFGNDPNSASSQFYITLGPKQQLDNKYTVFGGVIRGMEAVQSITTQDRIINMAIQN